MYVLYYCIFINNAYKTINSDENVLYGISKMNIYYIYINIYPHTIECGVPNNGGRKTLDGNFNRQRRQPTFSTHGRRDALDKALWSLASLFAQLGLR